MFFLSPLGKALWHAMGSVYGWKIDKNTAYHEPSNTKWWFGSGGFFFDTYDQKRLGLFERHFLFWRFQTLRNRVVAAQFPPLGTSTIDRLQQMEARLKKAEHYKGYFDKYVGVKKPSGISKWTIT